MYNKWLEKDIIIEKNKLDDGSIEYSILVYMDDVSYRIIGKFTEKDLSKIVNNLNFK